MTAQQWFDRRELLAERFGVEAAEVPAEAVWFLPDPTPLTKAEALLGRQVWARLQSA